MRYIQYPRTDTELPIRVNNQPETLDKSRFYLSPDPPRIPLVVGGL
jgi:hypothetical protein